MFAIGFGIGAVLGGWNAYRRKGNLADILQYVAGYGIACGLLFMFVTILYLRLFA
ncbi:MAG: hypothetical protein ABJL99_08770 [Aliishimia sp.]